MIFKILFLLFTFSISSQEKKYTYYIDWNIVKDSKSYFLELRNVKKEIILSEKISTNHFDFKLNAGTYEYRIASMNKFGKPSLFSNWETIKIDKDKPKEVKNIPSEKLHSWNYFVPGLIQFKLNKKVNSYLWIIWFSSLAITGNYFREKGNELANKNLNDPVLLSLINLNTPIIADAYFYKKLEEDFSDYNQYQDNQRGVGILALVSYLYQIYQARDLNLKNDLTFQFQYKQSTDLSYNRNAFQTEIYLQWRF